MAATAQFMAAAQPPMYQVTPPQIQVMEQVNVPAPTVTTQISAAQGAQVGTVFPAAQTTVTGSVMPAGAYNLGGMPAQAYNLAAMPSVMVPGTCCTPQFEMSPGGIVCGSVIVFCMVVVAFVLAILAYIRNPCCKKCKPACGNSKCDGGCKKCKKAGCHQQQSKCCSSIKPNSMTRAQTGTQSLPSGGASTILFPLEQSLVGSALSYNVSTGVFTTKKAGTFLVTWDVFVNPPSSLFPGPSGAEVQFWIAVNGTDLPHFGNNQVGPVTEASDRQLTTGSAQIALKAGDEVEIRGNPVGGAPVTLDGSTVNLHAGITLIAPAPVCC